MRRGRIFFYLAFILILGLVAVGVIYFRFLGGGKPAPTPVAEITTPAVEMTNVVVVTQDVPRGSLLEDTVLGTVPWQKDQVIEGMFTDPAEVVGRQARFDMKAGTPLTNGMLVGEGEQITGEGSIAALSIPRGMVAVSLPIDDQSSVSYALRPGDHVNLIVSMSFVDLDTDFQTILPNLTGSVTAPGPAAEGSAASLTAEVAGGGGQQGRAEIDPVLGQSLYVIPSNEAQRPRTASQTLLQDAVVLQMGEFPIGGQPAAQPTPNATQQAEAPAEGQATATPAPPKPRLITLVVSPQDAVTLNYLYSYYPRGGVRLSMALRSVGDDTRVQTEAVTLQFLLDQYRIPVPVKLPYGVEPRADIPNVNSIPPATTPVPQQ